MTQNCQNHQKLKKNYFTPNEAKKMTLKYNVAF